MAREPIRREPEPKPEPLKAAPQPPAAEAAAERPKVALHLGKATAPAVYATPYGSEPANFDPKTGLKIAKPAA